MISANKLIELLREKLSYDEVDEALFGEIKFIFTIIRKAKSDLRKRGYLVNGDKDGKLYYVNPSIKTYQTALNSLLSISKKFGLSPADRAIIEKDLDDEKHYPI